MPEVELLFPNVEMRLDIKTDKTKPINMHLLFSPDDPDHEQEIERLLGQLKFEFNERSYFCTATDLARLGRDFDKSVVEETSALRIGTNQFKTTLTAIRDLFRNDKWLRNNCLVAVAGSSNDGTAGLKEDDSYAATRREIEKFANVIFASTPRQREFWLGKLPSRDQKFIEESYGSLRYQITRLTTPWYDFSRRDRLAARIVPMFLGCRWDRLQVAIRRILAFDWPTQGSDEVYAEPWFDSFRRRPDI